MDDLQTALEKRFNDEKFRADIVNALDFLAKYAFEQSKEHLKDICSEELHKEVFGDVQEHYLEHCIKYKICVGDVDLYKVTSWAAYFFAKRMYRSNIEKGALCIFGRNCIKCRLY